MSCKLCQIQQESESLSKIQIYSDEVCVAVLSKRPASLCHVVLFPKKHYTILEQVPDTEMAHLMSVANTISMSMFDAVNVQGTNIYIENGVAAGQQEPHFVINILSRMEKDDVKLQWEAKKSPDEELSLAFSAYTQELGGIAISAEKKVEEKKVEEEKKKEPLEENNYLVKYYRPRP